jgi:hypothetical protein
MSLISLVIVLIIVGVLLWLVNSQLGAFIAPPILKIINVVVVVVVVLWLLGVLFGGWQGIGDIRIGHIR